MCAPPASTAPSRVTYMCCAPVVFNILLDGVSGPCEEWDQVRHMSSINDDGTCDVAQ
jgi:hypothetical protein